jgi:nucleotide-binding universal stress UspA family protein
MKKKVLVFIDVDDQTEKFVQSAMDLLGLPNNEFKLIHVAAPDPDFVGYQVGPKYIRDFRAEELREEHRAIQAIADKLSGKGLSIEGLLVQGPTTESILAEVTKLEADLIVLGSHKHGFLYQSFFGSVTNSVLKKVEVPTLVIPI